jgi:hypothetical protein
VKFRREYTRTVLSEVAVAMRGKPLGFGIDTQARDAAAGLNSARGRIRIWVGEAILAGRVRKFVVKPPIREERRVC